MLGLCRQYMPSAHIIGWINCLWRRVELAKFKDVCDKKFPGAVWAIEECGINFEVVFLQFFLKIPVDIIK